MKSISIIVPAYLIDEQVRKLAIGMLPKLIAAGVQVIVVENGSSYGIGKNTADVYIHKPAPIGYTRAVNIGLAIADGHYLVVSNVDIEFPQGWLQTLIHEYEVHGPGVLSPDDHGRGGVWEESWYRVWMTDRNTFSNVGYLDQGLPHRTSDQDYSIRIVQKGFKVQRTGAVQVYHHESSTFNKMGIDWSGEADEMIRRYGCVHFREWRAAGGK